MNTIITKKVRLIPAPAPFVGTKIDIDVGEGLTFKLKECQLAPDHESITFDWGDGTQETFYEDMNELGHVYPAKGEYQIRVTDDACLIRFGDKSESSDFSTIYAPMVLAFVSNATCLEGFGSYGFGNCVNLERLDIAPCPVEALSVAMFRNCIKLAGDLYFPSVVSASGKGTALPFYGCSNISALHFSLENQASITTSPAYTADPTLGTGVEGVCRFDP